MWKAALRRFLKWCAVLSVALPTLNAVLKVIGQISNIDFVITARGNSRLVTAWNYLMTPVGNVFLFACGLLYLFYLSKYVPKTTAASQEAETPSVKSTPNGQTVVTTDERAIQTEELNESIEKLEEQKRNLEQRWNEHVFQNRWLFALAETQAKSVNSYVSFDQCIVRDMKLDDPIPSLIFGLHFTNHSIYSITIELEQGEGVLFMERRLNTYPIVVHENKLIDVPCGQQGYIYLEQPLRREEAEYITQSLIKPDAQFYFGGLIATVKGGTSAHQVLPQRLQVPHRVRIQEPSPAELKEQIAALKSQLEEERARNAKPDTINRARAYEQLQPLLEEGRKLERDIFDVQGGFTEPHGSLRSLSFKCSTWGEQVERSLALYLDGSFIARFHSQDEKAGTSWPEQLHGRVIELEKIVSEL